MSEAQEMHVGGQRLQRFADGELEAAEAEAVRRHVAGCAECAGRLEAAGRAGEAYLEFHRELKAHDPAPPRAWDDLRPRLAAPRRGVSWRAWAAVAAAVVVAIGLYFRMARPAPVRAAELLRRAVAAEAPKSPSRRIRVRTSKRETVRPAVWNGPAASGELETMFLAARFSWQDPLSARSFAAWRDRLPEKRDTVRQSEGRYEIETTTATGPLHSATLVLDARDLRPVRETLQFATDRVEITEAEAAVEPGAAAPAPGLTSGVRREVPADAGPALELRVIAALHAIGADLGEPVEVARDGGAVVVTTTGLTTARERQVRDAVAGMAAVEFRTRPVDAAPEAAPAGRSATASGVPSQLAGILGEEGINRILDASEAVMARVYALRGLSRRFPQAREAELADADRDVLAAIRDEHVSGIERQLRALDSLLTPLLTRRPAVERAPTADWHTRAERMFAAAQSLDRLLNSVLAGGQDFSRLAPELTSALERLESEVTP